MEHVAMAETDISASPAQVWEALTDPEQIRKYMMGATVETDWKPGSPIVWRGEWEGKPFEDKGKVVAVEPERRLELTHFSPLGGEEDAPANYHTLVYDLQDQGTGTRLTLSQDGNASAEEADRSKANWEQVLSTLKEVVERG